jgi:hypothetical protein
LAQFGADVFDRGAVRRQVGVVARLADSQHEPMRSWHSAAFGPGACGALQISRNNRNAGACRQAPDAGSEASLGSLADGMPLTSGNALGFDRLLLVILGAQNLGEVQAFPEEWL